MAVKILPQVPIHNHHLMTITLVDDFGKTIEFTHYPVQVEGDPFKGFTVQRVPSEPTVNAYKKLMEQMEAAYLAHLIENNPGDPIALAHPDHPNNKGKRGPA
jgi:hypothetical protein